MIDRFDIERVWEITKDKVSDISKWYLVLVAILIAGAIARLSV